MNVQELTYKLAHHNPSYSGSFNILKYELDCLIIRVEHNDYVNPEKWFISFSKNERVISFSTLSYDDNSIFGFNVFFPEFFETRIWLATTKSCHYHSYLIFNRVSQ